MTMLTNDLTTRPTGPLGDAAATGARPAIDARMRETAQEFEAVFLAQVLQTMNAGIGGPGPFSDGDNEAWSGMLQEEYGRLISRSGGIGVADSLLREMLKMQESG
jgi:Rod binding domain-containing protein